MQNQTSPDTGAADNLALASLILSIISIILAIVIGLLSALASVPGIICGSIAIKKYRSCGVKEGTGMAKAGVVIGWISILLSIIATIAIWIWISNTEKEIDSIMESIENLN